MAEACGELHYEMETDETIFLLLDNFYLFPFGSFPPPPPYFLIILEFWFALLIILSDG